MTWSLSGARAASMHLVKVRGERARPNGRTRYWNASPPESKSQELPVRRNDGNMEVASFRPIVANQSSDMIWLTMVGIVSILNDSTIQVPQIQNWTQPPILLGNYEVPAVEPGLPVWRRNTLYGLLNQQGVKFLFHHPSLLWVHRSPDHPIELRGAVTELQSVPYMQDPWRYIWKALPCADIIY